jgi:hypothetical protein
VRAAALAIAVTEPGAAKPSWAAVGLSAERLADLPAAWRLARRARLAARRAAHRLLAAQALLCAAALAGMPLGGLVLLDELLLLATLHVLRARAEGAAPAAAKQTLVPWPAEMQCAKPLP